MSSLRADGEPYSRRPDEDGAEPKLVVIAEGTGGRFSEETQTFLRLLAQAKTRSIPNVLRARDQSWLHRWGSILFCAAARAFACSLLCLQGLRASGVSPRGVKPSPFHFHFHFQFPPPSLLLGVSRGGLPGVSGPLSLLTPSPPPLFTLQAATCSGQYRFRPTSRRRVGPQTVSPRRGPNPEKEGEPRRVEPRRVGGPKISRFFPSPAAKFVLFFPLWGVLVEFWWCF